MNSLEFDVDSHTYRLGDEILPSVTTIIKNAGLIDSSWFTEASAWRGSAVHEAIFFDIHNDLDISSLHKIVAPYVDGWMKFKRDTKFIPIVRLCERRSFHPVYKYAGSPDLVGILNGSPVLIDIKTGECPTAGIQTAGYAMFTEIAAFNPKRFSLRLKPDATYKLKPHTDENDFLIFLDALKQSRQ
jgi:hypothetical protein